MSNPPIPFLNRLLGLETAAIKKTIRLFLEKELGYISQATLRNSKSLIWNLSINVSQILSKFS